MERCALVTGASGFLGSWLVERLVARGWTVRALLRPGREPPSPLEGTQAVYGDITDPVAVGRAVQGAQVVFHLAGIRRSPSREPFMAINAEATRTLCEAMVKAGATRLVLASSLAAVGPSSPDRPHVETDPLRPAEWYGESKAEAERIAFGYRARLEVAVARPPRILGPNDRENLVFFKLVKRGLTFELTGGPRPLSMVDVDDVVELFLLLGTRPEAVGEAFFATGFTTTLEELLGLAARALGAHPRRVRLGPATLEGLAAAADVVSRASGRHLPLNRKLARQLLAPAWTCSGDKARERLGFAPRRGLEESVARSAAWYAQQGWL